MPAVYMLAAVLSATIVGLEALPVSVEVDAGPGLPAFSIVGLPDAAVQEARERVRSAIRNSCYAIPPRRTTVNLAPGDRRKEGPALDLPIALGVLVATGHLAQDAVSGYLAVGELGLDGSVRPVHGVLAVAQAARLLRARALLVPQANAAEAAAGEEIPVYAVPTLRAAVQHLQGTHPIREADRTKFDPLPEEATSEDLADVRGQDTARRALEIAAAGGHNLLLIGPPGVGKTMLARRLPTILPRLKDAEAVEVTKIHSVAGLLPAWRGLITHRPFRAPHHAASSAAILGGGLGPRPGEITLAHHGVLFLDELPEFRTDVLEGLRQPMEDGFVVVARAHGTVRFPARFALVAAMNPCPCGYRGDCRRDCTCTQGRLVQYLARLSGPLLDRIDLQVEVPRSPGGELLCGAAGEPSRVVRARVAAARMRAAERAGSCRGLGMRGPARWGPASAEALAFMRSAADRLVLAARAMERVLCVARTIADLEGAEAVAVQHLAEALRYRVLDRWAPQGP